MANIAYDPTVIQTFAARLYTQANSIVAVWTALGLFGGAALGFAFAGISDLSDQSATFTVMGAVILAAIGYSHGSSKAFALKLQAQIALCQVQIEANTRS
jgi:hypothetical protein